MTRKSLRRERNQTPVRTQKSDHQRTAESRAILIVSLSKCRSRILGHPSLQQAGWPCNVTGAGQPRPTGVRCCLRGKRKRTTTALLRQMGFGHRGPGPCPRSRTQCKLRPSRRALACCVCPGDESRDAEDGAEHASLTLSSSCRALIRASYPSSCGHGGTRSVRWRAQAEKALHERCGSTQTHEVSYATPPVRSVQSCVAKGPVALRSVRGCLRATTIMPSKTNGPGSRTR